MSCLPPDELLRITPRRAQVLHALFATETEGEAAARLHMSYNGMRSHVSDLKAITHTVTLPELREWWERHREEWRRAIEDAAGGEVP